MNIQNIKNIFQHRLEYKGLSSQEASEQIAKYGPNLRPTVEEKTWLKRVLRILGEPMILLLLTATTIYFLIGELSESLIILFSLIPVISIEFIQENRTDQAIKALDKIMTEFASVYRDGSIKKMETKELVPNDLVYLIAGDKAPADGVLLNSYGLMIDESMLTGESAAVPKSVLDSAENIKEENKIYQNTLIVAGEGYMLVTDTGVNTAYGKLGSLLQNIERLGTPLQNSIRRLVKILATIALAVSLAVGLILTWHFGLVEGTLGAITIAIALIPEEFPIVFSVFLIMGVWRMTKQRAMVREMAMVEILGSATVICTDKTGTLTEGKMALEEIFFNEEIVTKNQLKKEFNENKTAIETALLSLEKIAIDPIEVAVQKFATENNIDVEKFFEERELVSQEPFESETKTVHHLWRTHDDKLTHYGAGAPESIIAQSILTEEQTQKIKAAYEDMANRGFRVIAVAKKETDQQKISKNNMEFVALIGMSDPPREGVKEAIETCQKAGIRVIMITGDNRFTAHSIAEQINLKHNEVIISGSDLDNIPPEKLEEMVQTHDIFCRVKPEQKFNIVKALQARKEIVAMTGDGVNDAPALKQANIGIAMGQKGTEVARAAAGIVLLDDNFNTIVGAVKEGRRIYDNIRQAFVFLFTFHIPIIIISLFPILLGRPLIFYPIHIIFLELLCDPAAVMGFENEKAHSRLMTEPPRPQSESFVNRKMFLKSLIFGLGITFTSLVFFEYYAIHLGQIEIGRTMTVAALLMSQTLMILMSRTYEQNKSNKVMIGIAISMLVLLFAVIYFEILHKIFHFETLSVQQIAFLTVFTTISTFVFSRIGKLFR